VFYATVNEQEFLQDTQNRRFWVLEVASFDLGRIDPGQFWAQMRQEYAAIAGSIGSGAERKANNEWGWFMSPTERAQMQVLQEAHKAVDPVEETLESRIITNVLARQAKSGLAESLNVTEILKRCGQYPVGKRETNIGARWLRRHGFAPDRQKRYQVLIPAPDTPWTYSGTRSGVNSGRDSD
jgi:predicted P-loop ATPase